MSISNHKRPLTYQFITRIQQVVKYLTNKSLKWQVQLKQRRITLDGFPEVVATSFAIDHVLVNLASRDVVVSLQGHIEKPLVVAKVKVHLTAIIQYKYLTCTQILSQLSMCTCTNTSPALRYYHN